MLSVWNPSFFPFLLDGASLDQEDRSGLYGAEIVLVGFDITDRESFEKAKRFWEETKCWYPMFAAIGNKLDLADKRQVSTEEAQNYFASTEPPVPYFEMSVKTGENVDKAFEDILLYYIKNRRRDDDEEPTKPKKKCILM